MIYRKSILENGSLLIVVPTRSASLVSFMAIIRAGPRFDPQGKKGLAHFVEHMIFKGSKNYQTAKILTTKLEKSGIIMKGLTYYDTVRYWINTRREHWEKGVSILLDAIKNPLFTSKEVEKEKKIVLEERRNLIDNPDELIWEIWSKNFWQDSSLEGPYLGTEDTIARFTREDVFNFWFRNYLARNTVFIIAGDLSLNEIKRQIEHVTLDNKRYSTQTIIPETPQVRNSAMIYYKDLKNITVAYGVPTVPISHVDRVALEFLVDIFTGGWSSRFYQKIVEKGLAYSIEAYSTHLLDTGYFLIKFQTKPNNLYKTLSIINNELEKIKKGNLFREEIERAKEYFTTQLLLSTETVEAKIDWFALQDIFGRNKKLISPSQKCKAIQKLLPQDIVKITRRYFNPTRWFLSLIGPLSPKDIKKMFIKFDTIKEGRI